MPNELKPCPFCGSTSLKIESKHHGTHYYSGTHSATVRCNKCHARGGTASCKVEKGKYSADRETEQRAIEAWNRRADRAPTRCKECKHYKAYSKPIEDFDGFCVARECETDETEFCSYGERRSEDV